MTDTVKGNKGEWSELYVLFKLLADGKLYAADQNLKKNVSKFYPVLSVLRGKQNEAIKYNRNGVIEISSARDKTLSKTVDIKDFSDNASALYSAIKDAKEGTFTVSSVWKFAEKCECKTLKASSVDKRDITLIVHDAMTNSDPELGFSIKSRLGSPSTLLNSGQATNFIYKISGNNNSNNTALNNFNTNNDQIRSKLKSLIANKVKLEYIDMENNKFKNNLVLIDSIMPRIMSDIVKEYYCGKPPESNIDDIVNRIAENPPSYLAKVTDNPLEFLKYKVKEFLTAVALGMTPGTKWSGMYDATGGYIVVKEDGDVLCYHIYERNEFREYLYIHTKLETPATSKGNRQFGKTYVEQGIQKIKLNLQIRFTK